MFRFQKLEYDYEGKGEGYERCLFVHEQFGGMLAFLVGEG